MSYQIERLKCYETDLEKQAEKILQASKIEFGDIKSMCSAMI